MSSPSLNRRQILQLGGMAAAGLAVTSLPARAESSGNGLSLLPGQDICRLTPEVTEGPFYVDPGLVRADITEGQAGIPLTLRLQVVDAACAPLKGARVDIWHANADGLYSGVNGGGQSVNTADQTWLRGTQLTDASGLVTFSSIYPGWYRGRTTHVHFKVFIDATNVLTGQLFFPDALSEFIYRNVSPYSEIEGSRDMSNREDGIAQQASQASFAYVKELSDGYLASLIVGVDPEAESSGSEGPGGPRRGDMPPPPPGSDGMPGMPPADSNEPLSAEALVPGLDAD